MPFKGVRWPRSAPLAVGLMAFTGAEINAAQPILLAPLSGDLPSYSAFRKSADPEYGRYLAGECVTCHSAPASESGIPSISGIEPEYFFYMMITYQNRSRENKSMQMVARRLDNVQIASLALFFSQESGSSTDD